MLKIKDETIPLKDTLIYSLAVLSLLAGFTMLFIGMFLPPAGQIHESVITAFGIILIFVGSLLGISMHYANETDKFKKAIIDRITHHDNTPKDTTHDDHTTAQDMA